MRIVDLKTFRTMPEGTVFMKYEPCCFDELCVKGRTLENDFLYADIVGEIEAESSDEFSAKLTAAENTFASIPMDFNCYTRDGCFDPKQLFAIYEKQDIEGLIAKLQECKENAYDKKNKAPGIVKLRLDYEEDFESGDIRIVKKEGVD